MMDAIQAEGAGMSMKAGPIITPTTLRQRQSLPLDAKVSMTLWRIREWYDHWEGDVYVSFSGGLDSTVLLDLVWSIYPNVPAVFCNTGLEYPEIVQFVRTYGERVTWLRPQMSFAEVLRKYGYPVVSKRVARYIHEVRHSKGETATKRLRLTGIRSDGTVSMLSKIPDKWQFLCYADFDTSDRCCMVMKKRPFDDYFKQTGRRPYLGTRAAESQLRKLTYFATGCNAYKIGRPKSAPLSVWLDADIREYIDSRKLAYCTVYDMGYKRTGCMFCMFGVHLEAQPNRFQRMARTHPRLHAFCMDQLGCRNVLRQIGVPCEPDRQGSLFEGVAENPRVEITVSEGGGE